MATMAAPLTTEQSTSRFGTVLVVAYVFLLVSRVVEFAIIAGAGSVPLLMITTILGIAIVFMTGRLLHAFASITGKFVLALTCWILVTTGTSTWHGGSVTMLNEQWSRTLLVFIIVTGVVKTQGQFRKVALAIGWGTAVVGVLGFLLGNSVEGRLGLESGMVGNPNLLAFHLLFGLPFCLYVLQESNLAGKLAMFAAFALMARVILATGSRSGLILAAILLLVLFFRVSLAYKVKMLVVSAILVVVGVVLAPSEALERYRTLLSDEQGQVETQAYQSAAASEKARISHLNESLTLTLQNPIFGVGPGVFVAASAEHEKSEGLRQMWRETHNAYTQVSSECGIPGLILFLCVMGSTWRTAVRAGRAAKARADAKLVNLAFYVKLSLVVFAVGALATSNAYQYYLFLLAAIAIAMESTITGAIRPAAGVAPKAMPLTATPTTMPHPLPQRQPATAGARFRFGGYRRPRDSRAPAATK